MFGFLIKHKIDINTAYAMRKKTNAKIILCNNKKTRRRIFLHTFDENVLHTERISV